MFDSVQYLRYFLLPPAAYGRNSPSSNHYHRGDGCNARAIVCSMQACPRLAESSVSTKEAILLRIFLVDDNAMARAAVKMALQRHPGWVVVGEASDGGQALETFRTYAPQVTVMDFLMPEMNGLDTARRLMERNPNVLILMITSDPSSQLEEQAREAGIKGVCAKGELHRLENAIDAVIHGGTYFSENIAA
jgi:CheY-like chemotaxis protein